MPVEPCVTPTTHTDELLAQVVGLLGDVLDRLPEPATPQRERVVTEPKPAPARRKQTKPKTTVKEPDHG